METKKTQRWKSRAGLTFHKIGKGQRLPIPGQAQPKSTVLSAPQKSAHLERKVGLDTPMLPVSAKFPEELYLSGNEVDHHHKCFGAK